MAQNQNKAAFEKALRGWIADDCRAKGIIYSLKSWLAQPEETLELQDSTNVLYFMKNLQETCQYPRQILDDNLAMDRGKIVYISQLPHGEQVITNVLNEEEPLAIAQLASRFGVNEMLTATKETPFMASLLYYFGVLTFGGYTSGGELILRIPNLVVRKLYIEQIQKMLLPESMAKDEAGRVAKLFYQTGNMQPLCQFMEQRYFKVFDNRDYRWTNEFTLKMAFLTLLFNDTFYIMDSETSLGTGYDSPSRYATISVVGFFDRV
ncbi:MAG: hypothetical protein ABFS56_23725 [Pseudomonadota bacterium]